MDTFYHRFLDRDRFEPLFVIPRAKDESEIPYDPTIDYIYTGDDDRLAKLVALFATADIAQFVGGFDPLSAEAARLARTPVIIELMHMVEPGQLYDYFDATICVSRVAASAQPDQTKCVVVHNGIDTDQFAFGEGTRDPNKIIIVECGRREKIKHVHLDELADELLALDPRVELWLAGNGQTGTSTDRLKFLGPRHDIAQIYRRADLMFLMSVVEPFGLVALEAMASGALPVVADDGGLAEIVTDGVDGFLAPGHDRAAVVDAVKRAVAVVTGPDVETWRRRARQTVVDRFSGRQCVEQYERVYLDLVAKKGLRQTPGPTAVDETPGTLVGDILFHFNNGRWEKMERAARRLFERGERLHNRRLIDLVAMAAKQAAIHEKGTLADPLFRVLVREDALTGEFAKLWAISSPPGPGQAAVAEGLAPWVTTDPALALLRVEALIGSGAVRAGVTAANEAATRFPDVAEIVETARFLRQKMGEE